MFIAYSKGIFGESTHVTKQSQCDDPEGREKWHICLKKQKKFSKGRTMYGEGRMVGNKLGHVDKTQRMFTRDDSGLDEDGSNKIV